MRRLALPVAVALTIAGTLAVWNNSSPLPLPTPSGQNLKVLVQPGALTYDNNDPAAPAGLEFDLIELLAKEMGVGVEYVSAPNRIERQFKASEVHFAAAWLTPGMLPGSTYSPGFIETQDLLIQPEASLPVGDEAELAGRTVHVIAGSRQAASARELRERIPDLRVVEHAAMLPFTLLDGVAAGRYELAIVDEAFHDVALQFAPALQTSLRLGTKQPIAWAFPERSNAELIARVETFLQQIVKDPAFNRLRDRYFGHVRRLRVEDIAKLLERSKTVLPKLKPYFQAAQIETGFDWRLLAALAYQESQWDANATSPTGVRGIMMLTEETADRLNVSNRLDPEQSIRAGARYLELLREQVPASTPEPDRTWQALAAYNIGPGHFNAARTIGKQRKADVDSWLEMKSVLPLLAKPEVYERLKSGKARGGEAVILVENIRSFYDILSRQEAPYRPLAPPEEKPPAKAEPGKPGLKPKTSGPGLKPR